MISDMPVDRCDFPVCDGTRLDQLSAILPPELLREIRTRQAKIEALVGELERIEGKGFNKTAEDVLRARQIEGELDDLSRLDIRMPFPPPCDLLREMARGGFQEPGSTCQVADGQRDLLLRIQEQGSQFVTAETDMFASSWSPDFLHGSDTLWPLLDLAKHILRDGERIRGVQRVTWRKPMTSNMQLAVMRDSSVRDANSALDGEIKTNEGVLHFAGQLIDSPIRKSAVANPYVTDSICSCGQCCRKERNGTHQFSLREPRTNMDWVSALNDPALQAASLVEIVTVAMASVDIPQCRRAVLRLMGGVSDLTLSRNPEDMFGRGKTLDLRIDQGGIKTGRSGMTIVPFTYMFPHQTRASRGFAALTDSHRLSEQHLEDK